MRKRYVPPQTEEEIKLQKEADEVLKENGCGKDGLPYDPQRMADYIEYRRRTTLTPTNGQPR